MQAAVVINAAAGSLCGNPARISRAELEQRFQEAGVQASFTYALANELCEAIDRRLSEEPDVLVVGGGDGTLSTAAARLVNTEVPLAPLPLGTLNHFCKDLGLGAGLDEAVRNVANGLVHRIDVAQVNGRIFINNCSVGAYPAAVRRRERLRRLKGHGKMVAMILATLELLRRLRRLPVRLDLDGTPLQVRSPFVLVSNNRYDTHLLKEDRRERLDAGELWAYAARTKRPRRLFLLALRSLVGRLEEAEEFESWRARKITLGLPGTEAHVGIDGEVTRLNLPLEIASLPGALRVIAPAGKA